MNTRFLTVLTTLAFLGFTASAVAHPCQDQDPPDTHKHCPDSGDGGNANGMGSNISMDCLLGVHQDDTIKHDDDDPEPSWYEDAVDKVDCSIQGPSIPWPIRLGVGGGNGRWANVRQVDINLGDFKNSGVSPYEHPVGHPGGKALVLGHTLLQPIYPNVFAEAKGTSDMDPLRLNVRPYRKTQTEGSIHLLTPGKAYEMGMRFRVPASTGIERFAVSIASEHYPGNEGFTGIACESGDELNILSHSPELEGPLNLDTNNNLNTPNEAGRMRDVLVYLWDDGPDDDDFPDAYTVTTGSFKRNKADGSIFVDGKGSPTVIPGIRWAAVCSATGPKECGNPKAPNNCNFLGYVAIQFTLDTVVN